MTNVAGSDHLETQGPAQPWGHSVVHLAGWRLPSASDRTTLYVRERKRACVVKPGTDPERYVNRITTNLLG